MGRPRLESVPAESAKIYGEGGLNLESATDEELMDVGAYGDNPTQKVYLKDLVMLPQVREGRNPVADEITSSIWNTKTLLNQIDVAKLTPDQFQQYVDFCNRLWKANIDPADYPVAEDGFVYLVMAGHTRFESMIELEDAKAMARAERGLPDPEEEAWTKVKIKEGIDPLSILSVQVNENIHRGPTQERQTMALVESYLWGLETGKWKDKTEFLQANGKYSREKLNEALHFASLPPEARRVVIAKGIPYRAGVELGKTMPILRENLTLKYLRDRDPSEMNEHDEAEIENAILVWLAGEITHIQISREEGRFNGAVITSYFVSKRKDLKKYVLQATGKDEQAIENFEMAIDRDDWAAYREKLWRRYCEGFRKVGALPLEQAAKVVGIHAEILSATAGAQEDSEGLKTMLQNIGHNYLEVVNARIETILKPQEESLF